MTVRELHNLLEMFNTAQPELLMLLISRGEGTKVHIVLLT